MSLVAWYPLNNSVKNQGVLDLELTQITAPTYVDGKVTSKALKTGAFKWTAAQSQKVFNKNEFSYACWFKNLADDGDTTNRAMIFGSNSPRIFSIFQHDTASKLHLSWYKTDGTSTGNLSTVVANAFPKNTWVHLCVSYSSTTGTHVYLNGVQKYENLSWKCELTNFNYETQVIYNSAYHVINDVRIYNHCLSLKEVKELANNQAAFNLYKDESKVRGNSSSSSYTKTKLIGEDGYNYKGTYTGTGGNSWANIGFGGVGRENIVPGTSYTWTCKIRIHKWTGDTLSLRNSIIGNDYTNGSVQVANTTLPKNVWLTFTRTKTLTEGMKNGSTTYYITDAAYNTSTASPKAYMSPLVEFYTGARTTSGFVYEVDFDLKDIKLMKTEDYNKLSKIPVSIDNTGNIFTNEFIETSKNSVEKEGLIKTAHFMENYITEPDGAVFQQIAFHLDPTSYKFASSDNFNDCYIDCRRWFNAKICDLADKWEFLLIQRATENAATYKTRWSQTKNPNSATYEDVVAAQVTKNTTTGYTNYSAYGGVYKFNSSRYYCFANATKGNSFGIGQFGGDWQGGCPGYGGIAIKDGGYQSLYIRIDNLSDTALKKIHAQIKKNTNTIISNQFYEFI